MYFYPIIDRQSRGAEIHGPGPEAGSQGEVGSCQLHR